MKISVVVNTYNEEKNINRCLQSVKDFADEIILVDMHSDDKTVEIARKFKAKVFQHEYTRFVEPARNFALAKATGDWILLLDADEELPETLFSKLKEISSSNTDYVRIPRKNIIFGKWITHCRWWPDYLIRFFKTGTVAFSDKIHVPPTASGKAVELEAKEEYAIIHHNIQTIFQYMERLNRYSDIQSSELGKKGYVFSWKDVVNKPVNEFLSRYFAGEGYKDGIHGLALSLLQAFSEFVVYLKRWETENFPENETGDINKILKKNINEVLYWQQKTTSNIFEKILYKIKGGL